MNCFSPNFQGLILMKNALTNQVGMLGDMFLWLVANLKQGVIYFIKQALPPNISAGSVGLTMTWFREKKCLFPLYEMTLIWIPGFMRHLIKKYWTVSNKECLCTFLEFFRFFKKFLWCLKRRMVDLEVHCSSTTLKP